jgi:hypothetical protein
MLPACIFYVAFFAHLSMLILMTQTGHTSYQQIRQGVPMGKTVVKIGSFEVDDAHLSSSSEQASTLAIPCKSDPDLCMQLDGWDEHTSIPAMLNGKQSLLYKQHYDRQTDAWVMRLE